MENVDKRRKVYIGDSVYAELTPYGALVLMTENGYPDDPRNRIELDASTWKNLETFLVRNRDPEALSP